MRNREYVVIGLLHRLNMDPGLLTPVGTVEEIATAKAPKKETRLDYITTLWGACCEHSNWLLECFLFFFPYGFFLLEKDIQDHGLAWKFSQDHDNPEIYNTKIQ